MVHQRALLAGSEHHRLLEIHLSQLIGPFDEKRGADIKVKGRKTIFFGL